MRRGRSSAARAYAGAPKVAARTHWREARFAVLDFELTGLHLTRDHVLSFGVVPVAAGRVQAGQSLYRVVRPPVPISHEAIAVHGLRPVDVEHAPLLAEEAGELLDALAGRALVAHCAWIEEHHLKRVMRVAGVRPRQPVLDTWFMARQLATFEGRNWRSVPRELSVLAASYGLPADRTHHALGDALTTAQLFLALASKLEQHGVVEVGLLAWRWPPPNAIRHDQ